jgi:hypothetical protein
LGIEFIGARFHHAENDVEQNVEQQVRGAGETEDREQRNPLFPPSVQKIKSVLKPDMMIPMEMTIPTP